MSTPENKIKKMRKPIPKRAGGKLIPITEKQFLDDGPIRPSKRELEQQSIQKANRDREEKAKQMSRPTHAWERWDKKRKDATEAAYSRYDKTKESAKEAERDMDGNIIRRGLKKMADFVTGDTPQRRDMEARSRAETNLRSEMRGFRQNNPEPEKNFRGEVSFNKENLRKQEAVEAKRTRESAGQLVANMNKPGAQEKMVKDLGENRRQHEAKTKAFGSTQLKGIPAQTEKKSRFKLPKFKSKL